MLKRAGSGILMASLAEGMMTPENEARRKLFDGIHEVDFSQSSLDDIYKLWGTVPHDQFDRLVEELDPHERADILGHSIAVGNVDLVEHLFAIGVDVNVETSKNHLPLVLALKSGQSPVVDAILNTDDVDVRKRDLGTGKTPLEVASAHPKLRTRAEFARKIRSARKRDVLRRPRVPSPQLPQPLHELLPEERRQFMAVMTEALQMVCGADAEKVK